MGLQGGFTKFHCYLSLWDGKNTFLHYNKTNWPVWSSCDIEDCDVTQISLVDLKKALLPPFDIKLSLIKQIVKELNPESNAFKQI